MGKKKIAKYSVVVLMRLRRVCLRGSDAPYPWQQFDIDTGDEVGANLTDKQMQGLLKLLKGYKRRKKDGWWQ
jgi:hypothetical protein